MMVGTDGNMVFTVSLEPDILATRMGFEPTRVSPMIYAPAQAGKW